MGILVSQALEIYNTGAILLRIAEKLEAGEIDVEGEKMPLSNEFKNKLEAKYTALKNKVKEKVKEGK